MYKRINECSLGARASMPNWFGELPMGRELGKYGKTKAQIMATKSFQNRWAIQSMNGDTRYKMVRKLTGAWKKRLKRSEAAKKNPEVRDLLQRVIEGQLVTEDEAVFVHAFYKRRQREAEIRARKKRRTAAGAAAVVGGAVGAYFLYPVIAGSAAATKATAAGATVVGKGAVKDAVKDAKKAGATPAEIAAIAVAAEKRQEGDMAAASAAGIIKPPVYTAETKSPTWWETLVGAKPAIQAVQSIAQKIPGVGVQKPGIQPTTVPLSPKPGIPKAILYGVPIAAMVGGAYFMLKRK